MCTLKKDKTPNTRFGEAVIVLGSSFISPFYSSKDHLKRIPKLVNLLNFTEDAAIKARLEKALAANQLAI